MDVMYLIRTLSVFLWSTTFLVLPPLTAAGGEAPQHPSGPQSPLAGLEEIWGDDVNLQGGFWGQRLETHRKTTIPHVLDKLEESHHVTNFDVAARVVAGAAEPATGDDPGESSDPLEGDVGEEPATGTGDPQRGIVGNRAFDSDLYKALEGACFTLAHADDKVLEDRVEGILARIIAAQEDDGYLVTYFTAKEPENRWADMRTAHELYNAGHFFEFAVQHQRLTGGSKAIDAAKRFADLVDRTFGPDKRYDVCGHQEVELALVKPYRATGEKRYLELCRFFIDERGYAHGTERKPFTPGPFVAPEREPGLTDQEYSRVVWRAKRYWRNGRMQDHKPLLEQTEAVGHAVRAGYIYAAMADLARFSDAQEYGRAVRILWEDVVGRKMYLTGGVGTAQYGDEGFGDPYLLPNKTYCESCAGIANVLWQHRMALLEANAKYADVLELVLYNSAISGIALSGDAFFYQNPLESRKGSERRPWIGLACCPTNLARFTPQVGGFVYAREEDEIYVNLYAAGDARIVLEKAGPVTIRQETDYPWDGRVRFTVVPGNESADFEMCLRIPGWAVGRPVPSDLYRLGPADPPSIGLLVNGEALDPTPDGSGYRRIRREWKAGDVVELEFPMPVRRVYSNEKLRENVGKVALMRGPLVYCFEGMDQPGVDLFGLELPRDAVLAAHLRPELLGGIRVIEGRGRDAAGENVTLTAIPYFAWANRGKSPMRVWLGEMQSR